MSESQKKSWSAQRQLLSTFIPTEKEVFEKILSIRDLKCQALVIVLYLTGCRATEILPYKYTGVYEDLFGYEERGITIRNLSRKGDWFKFRTRVSKSGRVKSSTLKNKDTPEGQERFLKEKQKKLQHRFKEIPVYCPVGSINRKLLEIFDTWIDYICPPNKYGMRDNTQQLFDFDYKTAHRLLTKNTDWTPHYIRHVRMTILSRDYGLSLSELTKFGGWASPLISQRYVNSNIWDIQSRMIKTVNERAKEADEEFDRKIEELEQKQKEPHRHFEEYDEADDGSETAFQERIKEEKQKEEFYMEERLS